MRPRAWQVGLAGVGLALLFVALRWAVAADGDISRFVVAGATFVDPVARPPGDGSLHVFPSAGYDGQFYWRLAVDPTEWGRGAHHGVAFDSAYRAPRIGYPVLTHLAAGGRAGLVVWSLVGVNVAAMGLVAYAGGRIAGRAGRSPLWGLAVAAAPGLVMALGRDLAECVTVACLVGGIAALAADRPLVATGAWTLAVLSREQALLTVAAYAACRLAAAADPAGRWHRRRAGPPTGDRPTLDPAPGQGLDDRRIDGLRRDGPAAPPTSAGGGQRAIGLDHAAPDADDRPTLGPAQPGPGAVAQPVAGGRPGLRLGWRDLPWVGPVVAFGAWQAVLWHATGRLPLAAAGGTNLVPPFTDLVPGLVGWASGDLGRIHAVAPLQLAVAVALVVAAARAARTVPGDSRFAVVALGLAAVAGTCLAGSIWRDPSDLRHLVDVSALSWVVLLAASRPVPRWAAWATALVWVATATARMLAI